MSPGEPARLGEYHLLEKLGQGGMAQVYRAERTGEAGFKKKVAIKRMLLQYRNEASLLERFAAEARTNARLDHPNLVQVVDFGIEPEPYLVMEFVEGVPLAQLLHRLHQRREKLEIAAACFIGAEAAQGLDHAHRKRDEDGKPLGIVHRDVSPQNILLSNEGAVKVSDFGLVKAADNVVQTGSGMPIGKMSYMAPEQAEHGEVDARADVFSLGVVIWEMLTLRPLLPHDDPAKATYLLKTSDFKPPSRYNDKVPPELDRVVMACLVRDPKQRTPSAQAVSMQLRELLHEIAPGYGREQLARLLTWAFPERGWQLDEPHETAAQPTAEERLSMPQASASGAMQRAASAGQAAAIVNAAAMTTGAHAAMTNAAATIVTGRQAALPGTTGPNPASAAPEAKSSTMLWIVAVAGIALFALLLLVLAFFVLVSNGGESDIAPAPRPPPMQPLGPSAAAAAAGVMIDTNVSNARIFIGPRELGPAPVQVRAGDLNGYALVALAPGHAPSVIEPDRLAQMVATHTSSAHVELVPSRHPEQPVFVYHATPAIARMPFGGDQLGEVPGIVLVPRSFGRPTPTIEVLTGARLLEVISLDGCELDKVCVVGEGS